MRQENMSIVTNTEIALHTFEMVLNNDYISETAVPGQFLHISVTGHTLRRPISIAAVDREQQTVTIIYKIVGLGTKQLSLYKPGMTLNVLGPNGNGFNLNNINQSTMLLIGGGVGIPPLHFLGEQLKAKGHNIVSILGFRSADDVFYEQAFKQFGETMIVTNDGTAGEKGLVTDVIDTVKKFDSYYTCGPLPMLQAVTHKLAHKQGFISLEERMGCGVGACFACVLPTRQYEGYKKICQDGPVFAAEEVKI